MAFHSIITTPNNRQMNLADCWKLIGIKPINPDCEDHMIIICELETTGKDYFDKYATWFYNFNDMGASSGHYFHKFEDAIRDFNKRMI